MVAVLALVFFASPLALASPLDLYGLSSRSIGRGGAGAAVADDYSALFYNPGRLGFVKPSAGAHFMASFDAVHIRLFERPAGYDVVNPAPEYFSVETMPTADLPNPRRNTSNDPNSFLFSAGIVHDFGLDWLSVGAALSVPLDALAAADIGYVDERAQYFGNRLNFQLLNQRANRPSFLIGLAFKPLKWFGFGATINVFGNFVADTHMFIPDAGNLQDINMTMNVRLKYDASAIVGLHFEPLEWMGIGISFRDRSWFGAGITNYFQLGLKSNAIHDLNYGFSYSPRTIVGGLRFNVSDWTLAADVQYALWSDFRAATDINHTVGFNNSVSAMLGADWRVLEWLELRAGLGYVQSPVPTQDGRTNFVDNDRVQTSLGASFHLPWVKGLSIDVHAQVYVLLDRSQRKTESKLFDEFTDTTDPRTDEPLPESVGLQTNNPGFPGYTSSGLVGTAGFGVQYAF